MSNFIFVGYLIQEPYWKHGRSAKDIESLPSSVSGTPSSTSFNGTKSMELTIHSVLTELPHLASLSLEPHDCRSVFHKGVRVGHLRLFVCPRLVEQETMTSIDAR